jgi:hypothetical protein
LRAAVFFAPLRFRVFRLVFLADLRAAAFVRAPADLAVALRAGFTASVFRDRFAARRFPFSLGARFRRAGCSAVPTIS